MTAWAIIYLPDWPIDILDCHTQHNPVAKVITEQKRHKKVITHINEAAKIFGIQIGMNLADAQTLSPGIEHHIRNLESERQALLTFAKLWRHLTPHISLYNSQSILLNMTTCIKLWGGLSQSIEKTLHQAKQFSHQVNVIWAPTPMAAHFFARSGTPSGHYSLNELGALNIQNLPEDKQLPQLKTWVHKLNKMGIDSFYQLSNIKSDNISQYFNQQFVTYLNKLLGKQADPRQSIEFETHFSKKINLDFPIKHQQTLLFPIKTLLVAFEACMRKHQKSALAFTLEFQDELNQWQPLTFALAEAQYQQSKIQPLVILKLDQLAIKTGVIGIKLTSTHWVNYRPKTHDFWGSSTRLSGASSTLLNRLYTRLGSESVKSIHVEADHRPEHAWSEHSPSFQNQTSPTSAIPRRPNWLLPKPKALNDSQQTPHYQGPLTLTYGPERIESGWWDTHPVARDYFIARHTQGYEYWIFKPLPSKDSLHKTTQWHLHGVFS